MKEQINDCPHRQSCYLKKGKYQKDCEYYIFGVLGATMWKVGTERFVINNLNSGECTNFRGIDTIFPLIRFLTTLLSLLIQPVFQLLVGLQLYLEKCKN